MMADPEIPVKEHPIVGALINNDLRGMNEGLETNVMRLIPVYLNSPEGSVSDEHMVTHPAYISMTIYRRTLSFVLAMAANRLFRDRRLVIGHSLGNGFYFHFDFASPDQQLTEEDVKALAEAMHVIIRTDHPIQRRFLAWAGLSSRRVVSSVTCTPGQRPSSTSCALKRNKR